MTASGAVATVDSNVGVNIPLRSGAISGLDSNVGINQMLMRRSHDTETIESNVGVPLPPIRFQPVPQIAWGVALTEASIEDVKPLGARAVGQLDTNVVLQEEEA